MTPYTDLLFPRLLEPFTIVLSSLYMLRMLTIAFNVVKTFLKILIISKGGGQSNQAQMLKFALSAGRQGVQYLNI